MATIRVQKNAKNPFVMIDRRQIQRDDLSFKARGIYAYLLSLPDDWVINIRDLANRSPEGKHAIQTGMKELREAGYLHTTETRDEAGRITGKETLFFEIPTDSPIIGSSASTDDPIIRTSDNPDDGKPAPTYKHDTINDNCTGNDSAGEISEFIKTFQQKTARQPYTARQRADREIPTIQGDVAAFIDALGVDGALVQFETAINEMIAEGDPPRCLYGALVRAQRNRKRKPKRSGSIADDAEVMRDWADFAAK